MTSISSSSAHTWITQLNLQTVPCLPLAFVCIHQMAPPRTVVTTSSCSLLLIYRPRKVERLSWPSWRTYSGRFTQVYRHEWSPVSCRSSTGQRKLAGQRPTFYRWATEPMIMTLPPTHGIHTLEFQKHRLHKFEYTHIGIIYCWN